jgi:hypothetical protein
MWQEGNMNQSDDPKYPRTVGSFGDSTQEGYTPDDDDTWGNKMLAPNRPLLQRHLELCRMAAHGKTNNEIAEKLGYTASRVSILLSNRRVKDQIHLYRDRLFETDTKTRMKEVATDAMSVIENILTDTNLSVKEKEKAAMWVLEKVDGKAAQQTDINVTGGIGVFLDQLDKMKARGETLDVRARHTPQLTDSGLEATGGEPIKESGDEFTKWLNTNLKD